MLNVWFTADTHFQHQKIVSFEPLHRPFKTMEEHDDFIIDTWNSTVSPNDIIYHLGDFCFGGKQNVKIASRLNGHKRLVMGNHDCYPIAEYIPYFEKIFGSVDYKEFTLTHIPIHPADLRGKINIHGHTHSKIITKNEVVHPYIEIINAPDKRYFCVSLEQNNLKPFHIDEIRARLKNE